VLAGYEALLRAASRASWDAEQVALERDLRCWRALPARDSERLQRLLAGFWLAEHQVAEHLDPYLMRTGDRARECLERQRADERRHTRFFERALRELAGVEPRDATALAGERIQELFCWRLQETAGELARGGCGLAEAVCLYHLVLEAIVLSAGQAALLELCAPLTATAGAVARVQRDERWHVGLGVMLLQRGDPADLATAVGERFERLAESATRAWGRELVDAHARERALATHRRRLALVASRPPRGTNCAHPPPQDGHIPRV
jgi:ribonucleotide reductase beta subunit family protein with ferritin-like domain